MRIRTSSQLNRWLTPVRATGKCTAATNCSLTLTGLDTFRVHPDRSLHRRQQTSNRIEYGLRKILVSFEILMDKVLCSLRGPELQGRQAWSKETQSCSFCYSWMSRVKQAKKKGGCDLNWLVRGNLYSILSRWWWINIAAIPWWSEILTAHIAYERRILSLPFQLINLAFLMICSWSWKRYVMGQLCLTPERWEQKSRALPVTCVAQLVKHPPASFPLMNPSLFDRV